MDVLIFMKIAQVFPGLVSVLFANLCRAETKRAVQGLKAAIDRQNEAPARHHKNKRFYA